MKNHRSFRIGTNGVAVTFFFPFRLLPILLAIYFALRLAGMSSDQRMEGPSWETLLTVVAAAFIIGSLGANLARLRMEKAFGREHPKFSDSILPIGPRVRFLAPTIIALALMVAAVDVEDVLLKLSLMLIGVVSLFLVRRLQVAYLVSSRFEVPLEGPLGGQVAEVLAAYGFSPKKIILFPSLATNAFAMPDGSVMVTTALRTLATDEEVAAVVAHEMSHLRDKEGKKVSRWAQLSRLPSAGVFGGCVGLGLSEGVLSCLPPIAGFFAISLSIPGAIWLSRKTQPMEFKCDADAAALGLGEELASALDKICRFMGHPGRWSGWDRFLVTHPSTAERITRLRRATPADPAGA